MAFIFNDIESSSDLSEELFSFRKTLAIVVVQLFWDMLFWFEKKKQ
jgi:hypothetical protein